MAKLVFGMNQSLDGYVDHMAFAPSSELFRHFIYAARGQAGSVYGARLYEVMRYWDEDHPEWDAPGRDFAAAWRNQPKYVAEDYSHGLRLSIGNRPEKRITPPIAARGTAPSKNNEKKASVS
jgi:hypothetical protein